MLDQLALIALGQADGFTLDEIDQMVKRLIAMSRGLRHAAVCPAPRHAECPSFQRLLKAASSGALESRQKRAALRRPARP